MIASQRHLFDIPDEITYMNCAYLSPLMRSVLEAGRRGLERKARPWEILAKDFWEGPNRARELFAGLINADADGVAVVPSASYGMATAARNLPLSSGQTVVVLEDQFPSNVTHWADLAAEQGG
ncbi:MAG: aminotransferase class V-fold PLP-dependent enzyme, partial [Alphaproteobacteria bacterium]|nr:aminotransferase class V-fold PLP-dependent enzyme [Alphaproteobacteria bacterium]